MLASAVLVFICSLFADPKAVLVFLSYAHADSAVADEVENRLLAAGCEVWRDTERIEGGRGWRKEIEWAITRSDVMVVLVSQAAKDSDDVGDEIDYARFLRMRIVPIQVQPVRMLPLIRFHWIKPKDAGKLCKGTK